jgi:hypothetical protein
MNRKTVHAFSTFAMAALVSTSFVNPSQARTTMASAGRAVSPADASCFLLDSSAMTNFCSSPKNLETSLVIDAGGTFTVTVNAEGGAPANTVGCQSRSVDKSARSFASSGAFQFLPTFGSVPVDIVLNPVPVPFRGGLFVTCQASPGGKVNTINW